MPKATNKGSLRRPKLKDVARAAGVSPATVSRVLNNPKVVRPTIQAKVQRAIISLGFTPDAAARTLKSRRSRTIGAVVPTLGVAIFADGIGALQGRLREHGYTLLVANSEYEPEKELQEISVLLDRGVDGIVLVGDAFSSGVKVLAKRHDASLVTTYVGKSRHRIPAVGIDNAEVMYRMTQYLSGLGHREFGIITDEAKTNDRTWARCNGALKALKEGGIRLGESRTVKVTYSVASGRAGLRKLMASDPAVTAVLCTSDALAIGALAESKALGLLVPTDLSITGFDDIEISAHTDPPLTTVKMPAFDIGCLAADHIVASIAGEAVPMSTNLFARMVIRESCAAPRRA
ncbi:MAG: LacI family transcriptional regulator [Acidobacteriaceae bacterium]|nr:LacI family transcriptional regulator [Acidobacteriaceae bacterium]